LELAINGEPAGVASGVVSVLPVAGSRLTWGNATYRGRMEVHAGAGTGTVVLVNVVTLEEYLYSVVPAEMPPSWPLEALKAQAVAARTYAVRQRNTPARAGVFDLYATDTSQVYGGLARENARSTLAVDQTRGEILTYGGQPILAVYHSTSGGHTENNEIVWSGAPQPYLRGVIDYDQESPHFQWTVAWTPDDIAALLQRAGYLVGRVLTITPAGQQGVSGRWTHYRVVGRLDSVTLSASQMRTILGLKSTLFEVQAGQVSTGPLTSVLWNYRTVFVHGVGGRWTALTPSSYYAVGASGEVKPVNWPTVLSAYSAPDALAFAGRGWGHGVGMSQHGARGMALLGHDYQRILTHYYRGAIISRN
jgi:stage II sporulation protein D